MMFQRLLGRWFGSQPPPNWDHPIIVRPVGWVRSPVRVSRMGGWNDVVAEVVVRDGLTAALDGIEDYSHIIVVTWMHQVPEEARALLHIHPRGDPNNPLQGVLATRTQNRPNPLGVAVVPLLQRVANRLLVRGLDAIHGTPVLDVKPYIPYYDSVPQARTPQWTLARGEGYWLGRR